MGEAGQIVADQIVADQIGAAERSRVCLVVIGASAGGVEALQRLVSELDGGVDVAVAVVLHLPATAHSLLPEILARRSSVPAAPVVDGDPVAVGVIHVAPPGSHLVVDGERRFRLVRCSEGHSRPGVDPLFRSAATAFGPALAAVVLSGTLEDGAAGLVAVKEAGGLAVVQCPDEAAYSSMPQAARRAAPPDLIASAADIGRFIRTLGHAAAAPPAVEAAPAAEPLAAAPPAAEPLAVVAPGLPSTSSGAARTEGRAPAPEDGRGDGGGSSIGPPPATTMPAEASGGSSMAPRTARSSLSRPQVWRSPTRAEPACGAPASWQGVEEGGDLGC